MKDTYRITLEGKFGNGDNIRHFRISDMFQLVCIFHFYSNT